MILLYSYSDDTYLHATEQMLNDSFEFLNTLTQFELRGSILKTSSY